MISPFGFITAVVCSLVILFLTFCFIGAFLLLRRFWKYDKGIDVTFQTKTNKMDYE